MPAEGSASCASWNTLEFFPPQNISDLRLVESTDVEPIDKEALGKKRGKNEDYKLAILRKTIKRKKIPNVF